MNLISEQNISAALVLVLACTFINSGFRFEHYKHVALRLSVIKYLR